MNRGAIHWPYTVAELWADGVIHVLGVVAATVASTVLLVLCAGEISAGELAAVTVYLLSLLLSIGFSAAYNIWPVGPTKWLLRRFDHSAIFLLIAGTYTPFLHRLAMWWLLAGVWSVALLGVALKLGAPGRFDRLSILFYLALGWSFAVAWGDILPNLPISVLWLVGAGGLIYSVGVVFHVLDGLRFHNAIWHGFVLVAASVHFGAVAALLQTSPTAAALG